MIDYFKGFIVQHIDTIKREVLNAEVLNEMVLTIAAKKLSTNSWNLALNCGALSGLDQLLNNCALFTFKSMPINHSDDNIRTMKYVSKVISLVTVQMIAVRFFHPSIAYMQLNRTIFGVALSTIDRCTQLSFTAHIINMSKPLSVAMKYFICGFATGSIVDNSFMSGISMGTLSGLASFIYAYANAYLASILKEKQIDAVMVNISGQVLIDITPYAVVNLLASRINRTCSIVEQVVYSLGRTIQNKHTAPSYLFSRAV